MHNPSPLTILLVDDDDVSCEAVIRNFEKHNMPFPIVTANDGMEALSILRHRHETKRIDGRYIILLDLNMPRMNGFEFLRELRADNKLSPSIVFVFTTSSEDVDRMRAYEENIAGYIIKSTLDPKFNNLGKLLMEYGSTVTLPTVHPDNNNGSPLHAP